MTAPRILVAIPGFGGKSVSPSDRLATELGTRYDFRVELPTFDAGDDVFSRSRTAIDALAALYAETGKRARFCLYGYSMGGVVVRTVLAMLEKERPFPPEAVRCAVSLDAPHTGAHIPLGLQYTFAWADGEGYLSAEQRKRLETRFRSKAAKQLLAYYLNWNDAALEGEWLSDELQPPESLRERARLRLIRARLQTHGFPLPPPGQVRASKTVTYVAKPHGERDKLLKYLAGMEPPGRWCGNAVKIAVANGSTALEQYRSKDSALLHVAYSKCTYRGELWVVGEPGGIGNRVILDTDNNVGRYFDLPKIRIRLRDETPQWVRGPGSLDRSVNSEIAHAILKEIRKRVKSSCKYAPKKPDASFVQENITFIPTVSALDLRVNDPFWLSGKSGQEILDHCPFDAVFTASENDPHAHWTDRDSTLMAVCITVIRAFESAADT